MIISFGWTTPALLAGHKTVTRREWKPQHAAKFKAGMLVDAWNTSPRNVKGDPHKVATIRLTADAEYDRFRGALTTDMPDWKAEGFEWMWENGYWEKVNAVQEHWAWTFDEPIYIVRFEVVEVLKRPGYEVVQG